MRRVSLWLNLSADLNPSQLVQVLPKPKLVQVLPKPVEVTPDKVQPMQKRGQDASCSHPDGQPMQERGQQHASCSHSDHLEIGPDLPGSVQDQCK